MNAWFNLDKSTLPSPADALPGRDEPIMQPGRHTVLGNPTALPFPSGIETACFALGCFWGAERLFWQATGIYVTAVGYTAGITPNPTYQEVCSGATGHTEAVLVGFDPAQIDYTELLRIFWEGHDPTQGMGQGNDRGTQYRSGIYHASAGQRETAEASRDAYQGAPRGEAGTARSRRRSSSSAPSTTPRSTISSTWTRTPAATAGWAAPA